MQDQPINEFSLGMPKIICRWRIYNRRLPMENRHLRALAARQVDGTKISQALVSWAKQHLEWTLEDAAQTHPNGVLMLLIDSQGRAAMSLGPYKPLVRTSVNHLIDRANNSIKEAQACGVSPEDLWAVQGSTLVWGSSYDSTISGSNSLIIDLARTLGMVVRKDEGLAYELRENRSMVDEVFLVSDEHGVVPSSDKSGTQAKRFAASYQKLLNSMRSH